MVSVGADGTLRIMDRENWIKAKSEASKHAWASPGMLENIYERLGGPGLRESTGK